MANSKAELERAWQAMQFICADMPGPRALPHVRELEDVEREMSRVSALPPEAAEALETILETRIRNAVDACRRERSSLG